MGKKDPYIKKKVAKITQLSNDDGLSMAAIARKMGMTRNAVAGIVFRHGIKLRESPPKNKKPKSGSINDAVALKTSYGFGQNKESGMENLLYGKSKAPKAKICAWPIGDPKKAGYHTCGKPAMSGKSYCKKHYDDAYIKTPPVKVDRPFSFHR